MAKTIKFRTHYVPGLVPKEQRRTYITEESLTVPGETRSIKELLARQLQGMDPETRELNYLEVDDIDNIDQFFGPMEDLTSLDEIRDRIKAQMIQLQAADKAVSEGIKLRDQEDEAPVEQPPAEEPPADNEPGS